MFPGRPKNLLPVMPFEYLTVLIKARLNTI